MSAWVEHAVDGSEFTLANLPWGVCRKPAHSAGTICVKVGDFVLDLRGWARSLHDMDPDKLDADTLNALEQDTLNSYLELGKDTWVRVRHQIQLALRSYVPNTSAAQLHGSVSLIALDEVEMVLPMRIGDYTDFYCSKEHATNVGALFRGRDNALNPNWLQMPIGYHGRASSIVVSGAEIGCATQWMTAYSDAQLQRRGQVQTERGPECEPSRAMDYEVELACVLGCSTTQGESIALRQAAQHIFGYMLMNDCSARDIQKWEYVPLGPFNGKNFATVVSPWIVQHEALEPFFCAAPEQQPTPLPYLSNHSHPTLDIRMTAAVRPAGSPSAFRTCASNFRDVYWTFEQMLAHHTLGGCCIRAGDIIASGTVSSPPPHDGEASGDGDGSAGNGDDGLMRTKGCLLELTENGKKPVKLGDGSQRTWLEDGDSVEMHAWCESRSVRIGFGECNMTLLPARVIAADG